MIIKTQIELLQEIYSFIIFFFFFCRYFLHVIDTTFYPYWNFLVVDEFHTYGHTQLKKKGMQQSCSIQANLLCSVSFSSFTISPQAIHFSDHTYSLQCSPFFQENVGHVHISMLRAKVGIT